MFIRTMEEVEAAGRVIAISHGKSSAVRLLLKADGLGFSVSEARGGPGNSSVLWYKNHWEANYVRSGRGTLEDMTDGRRWDLEPGMLYGVGPRDRHRITNTDGQGFRIVSVFNPPIEGPETHDADGAYPPTGEIPPGHERMFVRTLEEVRASGLEFVREGEVSRVARFVTAGDNLGFALSDVRFKAGHGVDLWYKNHWEANLVLDGSLEFTDKASGETRRLGPGALYCVGPEDRHHLQAVSDVHLLSVFNPPLTGQETHDADGAYPPTGPLPPGPPAG